MCADECTTCTERDGGRETRQRDKETERQTHTWYTLLARVPEMESGHLFIILRFHLFETFICHVLYRGRRRDGFSNGAELTLGADGRHTGSPGAQLRAKRPMCSKTKSSCSDAKRSLCPAPRTSTNRQSPRTAASSLPCSCGTISSTDP